MAPTNAAVQAQRRRLEADTVAEAAEALRRDRSVNMCAYSSLSCSSFDVAAWDTRPRPRPCDFYTASVQGVTEAQVRSEPHKWQCPIECPPARKLHDILVLATPTAYAHSRGCFAETSVPTGAKFKNFSASSVAGRRCDASESSQIETPSCSAVDDSPYSAGDSAGEGGGTNMRHDGGRGGGYGDDDEGDHGGGYGDDFGDFDFGDFQGDHGGDEQMLGDFGDFDFDGDHGGGAGGVVVDTMGGATGVPVRKENAVDSFDAAAVYKLAPKKNEVQSTRVTMSSKVQLSRADGAYEPADRAASHFPESTVTPASLDVDVAMYVVPDSLELPTSTDNSSAYLNLCATGSADGFTPKPVFSDVALGWQDWQVEDDSHISVECNVADRDGGDGAGLRRVSTAEQQQCANSDSIRTDGKRYQEGCAAFMPPTGKFDYEVTTPVNFKWGSYGAGRSLAGQGAHENLPETQFDTSIVFHFNYDKENMEADRVFSGLRRTDEDVDQTGEMMGEYAGGRQFASTSAGNQTDYPEAGLFPASLPYLRSDLQLRIQKGAAAAVMTMLSAKKAASKEVPCCFPDTLADIEASLVLFPTVNITWDLTSVGGSTMEKGLPLAPQQGYTLSATIEVFPTYTYDSFMGEALSAAAKYKSWSVQVKGTSITSTSLGPEYTNKAIVRYVIDFEASAKPVLQRINFTFQDFILAVASAFACVAIGNSVIAQMLALHRLRKKTLGQPLPPKNMIAAMRGNKFEIDTDGDGVGDANITWANSGTAAKRKSVAKVVPSDTPERTPYMPPKVDVQAPVAGKPVYGANDVKPKTPPTPEKAFAASSTTPSRNQAAPRSSTTPVRTTVTAVVRPTSPIEEDMIESEVSDEEEEEIFLGPKLTDIKIAPPTRSL